LEDIDWAETITAPLSLGWTNLPVCIIHFTNGVVFLATGPTVFEHASSPDAYWGSVLP
jgi:hypothetical protein